jgi:hypothetical protein
VRLHMHGPPTSAFALTEVRAACEPAEPPPPLKRWSARLVHRARPPDQRFRVRGEVEDWGLSGLFIGTYSSLRPLPYAGGRGACGPYAAVSRSDLWSKQRCIGLHGACPVHLHYSKRLPHLKLALPVLRVEPLPVSP